MNKFWKRYWEWSDNINEPFRKNKDRILLYVVLCQSVIVTITLLRLVGGGAKIEMICLPDFYQGTLECIQK